MIVTDFLNQTNYAFQGNDDDAPASGTTDFTMWLAVANRKLNEYYRDAKQTRSSLFEIRTIGTISSGNQVYDLDDDILLPADKVVITTLANGDLNYTLCKPQERDRFMNSAYISGADPQTLTFSDTIVATDPIVGGSIGLAGYWIPADLASDNDTILCDDPYWLVYATAAELSFNNLTYSDKYPELLNKANNLYSQMNLTNRRGTSGNPRTVRTAVTRIPGTSDTSVGRL